MKNKLALIIFAANAYGLPEVGAGSGQIKSILQIVLAIAGALAVLFLIISGVRYITSAGSPEAMSKAKNGLVYSIIGLVVCILAEAIVTFVMGQI